MGFEDIPEYIPQTNQEKLKYWMVYYDIRFVELELNFLYVTLDVGGVEFKDPVNTYPSDNLCAIIALAIESGSVPKRIPRFPWEKFLYV